MVWDRVARFWEMGYSQRMRNAKEDISSIEFALECYPNGKLKDIAAVAGIPKSTAHRILQRMGKAGGKITPKAERCDKCGAKIKKTNKR